MTVDLGPLLGACAEPVSLNSNSLFHVVEGNLFLKQSKQSILTSAPA
jgi:hypothetical protein